MRKYLPTLLLLAVLFLVVGPAGAQTSPSHDLRWHVLAGAGADMASPAHRIQSTVGQLSIGPGASPGYVLGAGYWYGMRRGEPQPLWHHVYLPLVWRSHTP